MKFALGKFADGEWGAIKGNTNSSLLMESNSVNGDPLHEVARRELEASLRYQHPDYYVAICPCYQDTITFSEQPESNITYANIFVNSNYEFYKEKYIEVYKEYDVHLVTHKDTNYRQPPVQGGKILSNRVYRQCSTETCLIRSWSGVNPEGKLFLFAAGGTFANILACKLWSKNKNNTYLDVGSTLNPWTKLNA